MLASKHYFHIVNPDLASYRLVFDFEKERIIQNLKNDNITMYSISLKNWHSVSLKAKLGDIIAVRDNNKIVYRIVKE